MFIVKFRLFGCGLRPFPLLRKGNLMQAWGGLASLILWGEVQTFWMLPPAIPITEKG